MSIYDKASLVHIPSGVKSGTLYNVLPNNADGDFDFTRSSTATRVNKDGLIETVAIGVPRLNYPLLDGVVQDCPTLLLEPSRSNLNTKSEDIAGFSQFTNVTATNNQTTSPDGSLNASLVTADAVNSKHEFQNANITFTSGTNYTVSVFVKANGYDYFAIKFASTGSVFGDDYAWFNVSNGTIGTVDADIDGTSIENYGNGWYKVTATQQANATASGKIFLAISNADNTSTFLGDGSSGLYVWGYQIEAGSYATSYLKTEGSTVTRSADAANGAEATFNDSEGVLYSNISALADDGTYSIISLSDNSSNNFIIIGYKDTTNRLFCDAIIGGTRFVSNPTTIVNQEQFNKICLKYKSGDTDIYFNGFKILSSSTTFTHSGNPISELEFRYFDNSLPFYGKTKEVMTFNEALSDSELEALTSYSSFNEMATEQLYTIE